MEEPKGAGDQRRAADSACARSSLGTCCVHAGEETHPAGSRPGVIPVYRATSYYFERVSQLEEMLEGKRDGYAYSRWGNATNAALESAVSTLLGGGNTISTASGMAANFAALQAAGARGGTTVLASREIYGNTYDILRNNFERNGARCVFADFNDVEALERLIASEKPGVVFFETLTNPTLSVLDAPRIIALAHAAGARVVVDNTLATPYLYRAFLNGADYETHSLTKYLNGHGDALGGSITCSPEDFGALEYIVCTQGAVLGPDSASLILRGIKTFALRMRQHCDTAKELASFLDGDRRIERLRFPGLASHPSHAVARSIFRAGQYGGMLSFDLATTDKAGCFAFIDALKLVTPSGSLGDVKSLIVHPSSTTHHNLSAQEKLAAGIRETTVRVSVGIEDPDDLIEDFSRALELIG